MTNDYRRVVGDTESAIEDTLTDGSTAVDISGFQSVEFHLTKPDDTSVSDDTNGAVTVEDSPNGQVKYDFQSGDLDQQGRYEYEWQVTFGDGGVLSFPSKAPATIWVREELA